MSGQDLIAALPPPEWDSGQPEFIEDQPFYSNQGAAGTCVRHAVAKAVQREIIEHTDNRIALHTMSLVQWLVDENPQFGANGCWPDDFHSCAGTLIGQGGYIYDVTINILATEDRARSRVGVIDLGDCLEGYEPGALHALFCESNDGVLTNLRNSWGTSHEYIELEDESPAWRGRFDVTVTDFVWRNGGDAGEDITFCAGGEWSTDGCEWPAF